MVFQACRKNIKLTMGYILILFMSGPYVFFFLYLMTWLNGFVNEKDGPVHDKEEILKYY